MGAAAEIDAETGPGRPSSVELVVAEIGTDAGSPPMAELAAAEIDTEPGLHGAIEPSQLVQQGLGFESRIHVVDPVGAVHPLGAVDLVDTVPATVVAELAELVLAVAEIARALAVVDAAVDEGRMAAFLATSFVDALWPACTAYTQRAVAPASVEGMSDMVA